jgi:ribonuclease P protein component
MAIMWPRLKHRRQFDLVYSRGRKRTGPALVLFHLEGTPDRQVAFVASRKVGGAVRRNRAKRLMREAFRCVDEMQPLPHGWLVLIARVGIHHMKSPEVAENLRSLLAELRMDGPAAPIETPVVTAPPPRDGRTGS